MAAPSTLHLLDTRDTTAIVSLAPTFPPYTYPSLTTNLICRVVLSVVSNLVCLVPLCLLYRNGEFAASLFILSNEIRNLDTIVNSLLWRDDDITSWWPGYGFCDFDIYLRMATVGIYASCLLAIMRGLASKVSLERAQRMTAKERRRRNWIQALIIFPYPIAMMAIIWLASQQRYEVATLQGCEWIAHPSWPFLVFTILPQPILASLTTAYALLVYKRYRDVNKITRAALGGNRVALQRGQRTKRRLYLMVISILIPYLPVVLALAVTTIRRMDGLQPYDFDQIHNHGSPLAWNTILYVPYSENDWLNVNQAYIPILTAIPIFLFFGLTKDAINTYRLMCLFSGLGTIFPGLRQEYDPDQVRSAAANSFGSGLLHTIRSTPSKTESPLSSSPSSRQMSFGIDNVLSQPSSQHDVIFSVEPERAGVQTTPVSVPNPVPFRTRIISAPDLTFVRRWFDKEKSTQKNPAQDDLMQENSGLSFHLETRTSPSPHPAQDPTRPIQSTQAQTLVWSSAEQGHGYPSVPEETEPSVVHIQTQVSQEAQQTNGSATS